MFAMVALSVPNFTEQKCQPRRCKQKEKQASFDIA